MATAAIPSATSIFTGTNITTTMAASPAIATPNAMLSRALTAAAPVLTPAPTSAAVAEPTIQQRAPKRPRNKTSDEGAATNGETAAKAEPKAKAAARANSARKAISAKSNPGTTEEATEATPAATDEATTPAGKDWLVVAKSVRGMLKGMPAGMHCGADALPMLNTRVQEILTEAASRAAGNGRKTLKGCDF